MEFIDDRDEFSRRLPLMADKRDFSDPVGLNWTQDGTDVDFGSLSRQLIGFGAQQGMATLFGHEVARPEQGVRRHLDGQGRQPAHRRDPQIQRQVRLRRRRRRRTAAAAEGGHQGGQGLRRFPGRRPVASQRQSGADRRAPGQGVRAAAARRPADVGAAPGHPRDQRQVVAAVRARSRAGRRSSSSRARSPTCRCRSSRTTWCRCWVWGSPRWVW